MNWACFLSRDETHQGFKVQKLHINFYCIKISIINVKEKKVGRILNGNLFNGLAKTWALQKWIRKQCNNIYRCHIFLTNQTRVRTGSLNAPSEKKSIARIYEIFSMFQARPRAGSRLTTVYDAEGREIEVRYSFLRVYSKTDCSAS